jgi:hypothetical protein
VMNDRQKSDSKSDLPFFSRLLFFVGGRGRRRRVTTWLVIMSS